MFKTLKNWACDHGMNLHYIFRSERVILNRSGWNLCLDTPSDMQYLILSEILEKNEKGEPKISPALEDSVTSWLFYALNEMEIYYKYDMFTIALASCYLGIINFNKDQSQNDKKNEKENNELKQKLINYLSNNLCINVDSIVECAEEIFNLLKQVGDDKTEDNEDDEEDKYISISNNPNPEISCYHLFDKFDEISEIKNTRKLTDSDCGTCETQSESEPQISFLNKKRKHTDFIEL